MANSIKANTDNSHMYNMSDKRPIKSNPVVHANIKTITAKYFIWNPTRYRHVHLI